MIGHIVFGIGLGIFSVAFVFWIVYLIKAIKANKAHDFGEELHMNSKMCSAGLFVAIGALVVNISNFLANHLS